MVFKNIISAGQFDIQAINKIFNLTTKIKSGKVVSKALEGKVMATLFYEPSTRTRLSFESAMLRLGGSVISTENASEFSSAAKGETLEDTIRVVNSYADVIVLRHFSPGASKTASEFSQIPIINAGDGNGEHPTQALLDLYTISSKFNNMNLTVAMVGDLLNGRTIHSLTILLTLYKSVKVIYVSPKKLSIPKELREWLIKSKIAFEETENLEDSLRQADVVYQTRIQKERFSSENEYLRYNGLFILDSNNIKLMKPKSVIMHPLPRVNEITAEIDKDPRAIYFEQVRNGLFIRMSLLIHLFDKRHQLTT